MLRLIVLLLLLANGAYLAWSQGLLRAYGLAPAPVNEPHRAGQQIRPEALQVLSPAEAKRIEAAAAAPPPPVKPPECLEAGLFDEAQAGVLRQSLEPVLPTGTWQIDPGVEPARWLVYMGKFLTTETMNRKKGELAALNVKAEALTTGSTLAYGLSLGVAETREAANAQLAALVKRGVRTARVVQERGEVRGFTLKLPAANEALRTQVEGLRTALAGHPLRSCHQP